MTRLRTTKQLPDFSGPSVEGVKAILSWTQPQDIGPMFDAVQSGDRHALLDAMLLAVASEEPWPEWLRDEVAVALYRYRYHHTKTLDEAFGVARPAGYRQETKSKRWYVGMNVMWDARLLIEAGASVDEALFEAVGTTYGIGKTTASKYYYWHVRHRQLPPPERGTRARDDLPPWLQAVAADVNWL